MDHALEAHRKLIGIVAKVCERETGTNVLRESISIRWRRMNIRAGFFLFGAQADSLWRD